MVYWVIDLSLACYCPIISNGIPYYTNILMGTFDQS